MSDRQIQDAIERMAGTHLKDELYMIQCTVDSVDLSARTCNCTAVGGQAVNEINDVRLMADVDDGFLIVPSIGSTVFVTYSKRNDPIISLFSSVDQVIIITGSTLLSVKDGSVTFNDGSFGGLIKIDELTKKLNNLESLVNDLATKYNQHTHILTLSSGTGTAAPTTTQEPKTLTATQKKDLENALVKHGK